ncbi:ABC transporter permease [Pseudonocardiaceae bacterium YIM PH 21723]|nr:ABC transporter permease [Pseudonocardiaceae bacterium YIM PH 21723]
MRAGFRRYSAYRQAALAGVITNSVFGLIRAATLATLFTGATRSSEYTPQQMSTYVWLGQGLLSVVLLWGGWDFAERIRTGHVAVDLYRPWDLQAALLAEEIGRAGYALALRFLPPMIIGLALSEMYLPRDPLIWLLFLISALLSVVISFSLRFMINLAAFWLLDIRGPASMYALVSNLLTGLVLPIWMFPGWAQTAIWATPFPYLLQAPIDVFVEHGSPWRLLGAQLLVTAIVLGAGRLMLRRAEHRLVVQGG